MNRYVCVHCHFYQPPRENPWLEEIEIQDSAFPFHDWNERVSRECYQPNGAARILDGQGVVKDVINLYERISFNFGPTLLSWLEEHDQATYARVLAGDELSRARFGGHGSAIAQAYNHVILPLAGRRDKEIQVRWGIADFEKRFKRRPESLWLPETAVDTETLEVLCEEGMRYVILAPHQVQALHDPGGGAWRELADGGVDPRAPYLARLPSKREIAVFFYDGAIAKDVAFGGLLHNGEELAARLAGAFADAQGPQLAHIANDGETYGHHHPHGEMALAYALQKLEEQKQAALANYGYFLDLCPPKVEVRLRERSSWSCAHGVERWRADCGCRAGGPDGWKQSWRAPLRATLDFVRDGLEQPSAQELGNLVKKTGAALDAYVQVILDRGAEARARFLAAHASHELSPEERVRLWKLLELQRHLQLMYTSCAWFFDELSGIEVVQNLQYALRAVGLARETLGIDLRAAFQEKLALAPSNLPEFVNGKAVFERLVAKAEIGFPRLGGHFAVASAFPECRARNRVYSFAVHLQEFQELHSGRATACYGKGSLESMITGELWEMFFGVFHLGDHNISAGVAPWVGEERYQGFAREFSLAFSQADFPNSIRTLDRWLGPESYSARNLFKNEQRKILHLVSERMSSRIQARFFEIYQNIYPRLAFFASLAQPLPQAFRAIAESVQSREIAKLLRSPNDLQSGMAGRRLSEARAWGIHLDEVMLAEEAERAVLSRIQVLAGGRDPRKCLREIQGILEISGQLPFQVDLARAQGLFFQWLHGTGLEPGLRTEAKALAEKMRVAP